MAPVFFPKPECKAKRRERREEVTFLVLPVLTITHSEVEPDSVPRRRVKGKSKVTPDMAAQIKRLLMDTSIPQQDIAAHFKVNQGRISEIRHGHAFREVEPAAEMPQI